jgi:hypothetical protein
MQAAVDEVLSTNPKATLADIAGRLAALPAAQRAETEVSVALGDPAARAGRVVVAHGALTNGGVDVARAYYAHGVDTVIYIHIAPADLKRLHEDGQGQLIVVGHLVGDALGIEPYVSTLRTQGLQVDVLSHVLAEPA